ncbi:hypothetical protein [Bacteroides sp. An19]|uniref:hypothetical protein n=1 Tax=Bacteroides sp. An19 TaxID=1965580 RepID=UPI001F14FD2E|nr:hypothetical protein [Bacteroides sp. An19]
MHRQTTTEGQTIKKRRDYETVRFEQDNDERAQALQERKKPEERAKLEAERQEREQAERERREKAAAENVVALARIKAGQIMSEAYAKAERMEREAEARKEGVSYSDYIARMSEAVGYGNGRYCGD